jgi:nucleotide sugar dehydrogenase
MLKNLKIGIIGHGFVGKAVDFGFSVNVEKTIIDPIHNTKIEDLVSVNPDVIFICVPTPMLDSGAIDCSIIIDVVKEITNNKIDSILVIKSSITPSKLRICNEINPNLVYNPEFLTERNANEDFINPNILVIGGSEKNANFVNEIHKNHSLCIECPVYISDIYTASLVKYTLNTFLATKVLFMNDIYKIFTTTDTSSSWEDFTNILKTEGRIGESHLKVPGPDGRLGFGGACFPKDISALINYAEEEGENLELLKSVKSINNKIRSSYDDLDQREKEQNVSFEA